MSENLNPVGNAEAFRASEPAVETGSKEEAIRNIVSAEFAGEIPQALFVLSGGIVADTRERTDNPGDDGYKTLSYQDLDAHGLVTGGKARVVAAAEIAKLFPDLPLVTTSRYEADKPTHAAVMAQELEQRSVPSEQIIKEEQSVNTVTELTELVKMAVRNEWKRVEAITSDYHIARCAKMFEALDTIVNYDDPEFFEALAKFRESGSRLAFIAAEEVLEKVSSKYSQLFEQVRQTDAFKGRVAAEEKGIRDLQEGRYKIYNAPLPPGQ